MEPLDQPCQHYQRCRQTQNCHCEKYHRGGRHLCQKLDHLPLLGDLGHSVGVVTAIRQSWLAARPRLGRSDPVQICPFTPKICSSLPWTEKKSPAIDGQGKLAERV